MKSKPLVLLLVLKTLLLAHIVHRKLSALQGTFSIIHEVALNLMANHDKDVLNSFHIRNAIKTYIKENITGHPLKADFPATV